MALNRLWWAGPLTIVTAMIANTIVRFIAVATLQPDPRFMPLGPVTPAAFSFFGVLGAVIAFALVGRISRRPIWLFKLIAIIALPITWVPDVWMLVAQTNPGTTPANVLVLMTMHVMAWAISVTMLTTLARN